MQKYSARDFNDYKQIVSEYMKTHFPDKDLDNNLDSESIMIDAMCYIAANLSMQADSNYNAVYLNTVPKDDIFSIYNTALHLGYKPKGKSPAITTIDISIIVPKDTNCNNTCSYDSRYLLTIKKGMKCKKTKGTPQYYETLEDVDFSSKWDYNGNLNRTIIPLLNSNKEIINYKIIKKVIAIAGETNIIKYHINENNAIPNLEIMLSDTNISEIIDVITIEDTNNNINVIDITSDDWSNESNKWYEVDYIARDKLFVDFTTGETTQFKTGYWKTITKRYITQRNYNGTISIFFGEGIANTSNIYQAWITGSADITYSRFLNNESLGQIPEAGYSFFIKYRKGGGIETNCSKGAINNIVNVQFDLSNLTNYTDSVMESVMNSLKVINTIPAIGGSPEESVESIRNNTKYWFAAQDRCVNEEDYISRAMSMPTRYGNIFRAAVESFIETNKHKLYILTLGDDGKLAQSTSNLIKYNLQKYLLDFRMTNDVIEITDGKIINIGIDFTIAINKNFSKQSVIFRCIQELKNYFNINKWYMGAPIIIDGPNGVRELLNHVLGVENVINLLFYQLVGPDYVMNNIRCDVTNTFSKALTCPFYGTNQKATIIPKNNMITIKPQYIFEIRHNKDIIGRAI